MDWIKAAFATFFIAWIMSLWHKADGLRERLGIYYVIDPQTDEIMDRTDGGGLGGWFNCPLCSIVLASIPGWFLRDILAHAGAALLLMRWFEGVRTKARWWL